MGPFRDRFDALYPGELDSLPVTAYTIDKLDGAVARDQGLTLSEVTSALIGASKVSQIEDNLGVVKNLALSSDELAEIEHITVISNSMAVWERLRSSPNVRLVMTGGNYADTLQACYGIMCEQALGRLRADWAFLSAPSVIGSALYHQDQEVVRVKRALMASAERSVMLLASAKFKRRALNHFAELAEFERVFIDKELDDASAQRLRQAGIAFELV